MHPASAPPVPVAPAAATRRLSALRAPLRARLAPVRAQKPAGDNMFGHSGSDTQQAHDAAKKAAAEAEKAAAKIREAAVPVRLAASARRSAANPARLGLVAFLPTPADALPRAAWRAGLHRRGRDRDRRRGRARQDAVRKGAPVAAQSPRPPQPSARVVAQRGGGALMRRTARLARPTSPSRSPSRRDCAPSGRRAAGKGVAALPRAHRTVPMLTRPSCASPVQAKEVFSGGAEQAQRTAGAASDVGASYAEQAKAQMGAATESAAAKAQQAKEAAGGAAEQAKQTLYGASDAAAAKAAEVKDAAAQKAEAASEHAGGLFEAVRARSSIGTSHARYLTRHAPPRCAFAGQGEAGGALLQRVALQQRRSVFVCAYHS